VVRNDNFSALVPEGGILQAFGVPMEDDRGCDQRDIECIMGTYALCCHHT